MKYLFTLCLFFFYIQLQGQPIPYNTPEEAFCGPVCDIGLLDGFSFTLSDANV
ncbi:MAG: hypothetical protein AAGK97_05065 [Bacteroidota bacterium]